MGRAKLEIKRIQNSSNRQVTFCKRRVGLMKKARELSILCDADVALVLFSSSGRLFEYAGSRSMPEIIETYLKSHKGGTLGTTRSQPTTSLDSQAEIKRLKEEMQGLQKEERWNSGDMEDLELLSLKELETLEGELESALNRVRQRQDELTAKQMEEVEKKEHELLRENESLRKELMELMRLCLGGESGIEAAATSTDSSSYNNEMASVDSSRSDSFLQLRLNSYSGVSQQTQLAHYTETE